MLTIASLLSLVGVCTESVRLMGLSLTTPKERVCCQMAQWLGVSGLKST